MRVLSISGKKRSTKRKSSKLRRRKGRYSGGSTNEEDTKRFQELIALQTSREGEYKNDNAEQEPIQNETHDGEQDNLGISKEALEDLETSRKRIESFRAAEKFTDLFGEFKEKVTNYLNSNDIEPETFDNLFANKSDVFIDNMNRIIERTMNFSGLSDVQKNKINNFNLLILLIPRFIDKVKTQSTDLIRKRMLMLLFAIMHGIYVVQNELIRLNQDMNIPDIPQPANVDFDVLELSDGLTPDEIEKMKTAIVSIEESMKDGNSNDVQGKHLKRIYVEILQPLYDKLTVNPQVELVNPTDPRSVPPVSGTSLNNVTDSSTRLQGLRGPPGLASTVDEEQVLKPTRRQRGFLSRTGSLSGKESAALVAAARQIENGSVPPPPPRSLKPASTNTLVKSNSLEPLKILGGKSRKRRKSRSRRSTRKTSRKSSRRRTRH